LTAASTPALGDQAHGALVAVSFLNNPGRKKDAGDTVVPALTPPQPVAKNASGTNSIASSPIFQFNLTCSV
jgi:hypothetical protein